MAGLQALQREGIVEITTLNSAKINANLAYGSATQFFKAMFPAWDGAFVHQAGDYAIIKSVVNNGVKATPSTTSKSTGMASVKMTLSSGFQVLLRFPTL